MTGHLVRQFVVPGALLGIVAIVLVARPDSDPVVTSPTGVAETRRTPSVRESAVADVKLELLNRTTESVSTSNRNPFRFAQKPVPVAATRRPAPPQNLPPVVEGPPPPPPIPLRFIGTIEASQRAGGLVGIFSDGRGAVMHAREGEIIEGRYRLLRMGADSVELAYADGRGRQTIRLSGQ